MWTPLKDRTQLESLLSSLGPDQGPAERVIRALASKAYADRVFPVASIDGFGLTLASGPEQLEASPAIWVRFEPRTRRFAVRYESPGGEPEEFSCEEWRADPLLSALLLRMALGRRE
jgi:hypothetical protein